MYLRGRGGERRGEEKEKRGGEEREGDRRDRLSKCAHTLA